MTTMLFNKFHSQCEFLLLLLIFSEVNVCSLTFKLAKIIPCLVCTK